MCTIAFAQDEDGRHYFVSVDGTRFRRVSHFPTGLVEANSLYGQPATPEGDLDQVHLLNRYGECISFMRVVK
jgi:hypothetical protein